MSKIIKYLNSKLIPLVRTIEQTLVTKGSTRQAFITLQEFLLTSKKVIDEFKSDLLTVNKPGINIPLEQYTEDFFLHLGADFCEYCVISECVLNCMDEDSLLTASVVEQVVQQLREFYEFREELLKTLKEKII